MTTPTTVPVRLQLRADTAANWTSVNPILLANELGRETDTGKIKIGNGTSTWTSLAYQAWATLPVAVNAGGTGQTTYTNGQLLIGNTTGNTLTKATLTAGSGVAITNGTGSITVAVDSTVVTTAQTGIVTSTMIADGTIVDADINASAGIVDTKLATITTAGKVNNSATTADSANTASAIVARDASGNFSAGTITADLAGNASTVTTNADLTGDVTSVGNATSIAAGVIVDADVNASAAIAGTKISPDFGSQNVVTTGISGATTLLVGTTVTPTGVSSGAMVAQTRTVIGSTGAGSNQVYAGEIGSITATTGTVVFKFKTTQTATTRPCFVRLAISNRSGTNTVSQHAAAEYAFQLHQTSGTVCTLNGATSIFEFTYVRATHFAFADLGGGECTVTLTNPVAAALTGAYRVELVSPAGFWTLDSVTTT